MKLIATIPINELRTSLAELSLEFPQFTIVESRNEIKIYKQVR